MRVDVVTLFPELFATFGATSFVGHAQEIGVMQLRTQALREFGLGRHKNVDDTPYGGGSGMVMRVDVLVSCLEGMDQSAPDGVPAHRILLTPEGKPFTQAMARQLATLPAISLICGRYEGFDDRIRSFVHEEISLGDFVMTGGEVAAMAIIEAVVRLLPGVLGNAESTVEESFSGHGLLLEYPQYTRPLEFRGLSVPEVLRGGNHAHIKAHRMAQAEARTAQQRPDLFARYEAQKPPVPAKKPRSRKSP